MYPDFLSESFLSWYYLHATEHGFSLLDIFTPLIRGDITDVLIIIFYLE